MIKISKYFAIEEFFPEDFFKKYGEYCIRWLSPKVPILADYVHERFGKPVIINNWCFRPSGVIFKYSGFRPWDCSEGAKDSRHKLGVAFDARVDGIKSLEVQRDIYLNYDKLWKPKGLTAIEDGTEGWTHFSVEWTNKDKLDLIPIPKV